MAERICSGTRADGSPCRAQALPGKEHCFAHDAELAEKRQAAYAAGGANRSNAARAQKLLPTQLRPVLALLVKGMQEVYAGELEPAKYTAMSTGANAIARLFGTIELEEQVRELEARHGAQ